MPKGYNMNSLTRLRYALFPETEVADLREALAVIAHEVGGDPERPGTVIAAAQSLREAVNSLRGYWDIPRTPDGDSQPFELVGR